MELFHVLVFDSDLEGTTAVYSDPRYNSTLATADQLRLMGVVSQVSVSGGTPTFTAQLEHSPDNVHFENKSGTCQGRSGPSHVADHPAHLRTKIWLNWQRQIEGGGQCGAR